MHEKVDHVIVCLSTRHSLGANIHRIVHRGHMPNTCDSPIATDLRTTYMITHYVTLLFLLQNRLRALIVVEDRHSMLCPLVSCIVFCVNCHSISCVVSPLFFCHFLLAVAYYILALSLRVFMTSRTKIHPENKDPENPSSPRGQMYSALASDVLIIQEHLHLLRSYIECAVYYTPYNPTVLYLQPYAVFY
jgi:hypothetical protein